MPEPGRVYFDSCVFIEILQQSNPKRFDACEDLRLRARARRTGDHHFYRHDYGGQQTT